MNIRVQADATDHLDFYCGECGRCLTVTNVVTSPHIAGLRCTTTGIFCSCPVHGPQGCRKFDWAEIEKETPPKL